jgi:hypothetical protein
MSASIRGSVALAGWACLAVGCSAPAGGETASLAVPGPTGFDSVAVTLVANCGTLDCHGHSGRNLRLYGYGSRRLDPKDTPGGAPTTPEESGVDYCSTVGLEPELMADVLAAGGERPERLTLIRKARGTEAHAGGSVFEATGPGDRCVVAWLSGRPEPSVCHDSLPRDPARKPPLPSSTTVDVSACETSPEEP